MKNVKSSFRYFLSAAFLFVLMAALVFSASAENGATTPFTDTKDHWASYVCDYVNENGIMNGVSSDRFAPDVPVDRAMAVTALQRLAKEGISDKNSKFTDVPEDSYYTEAVAWASSKSIVNGRAADKFAPLDNITRQEFATILYRYHMYAGDIVIAPGAKDPEWYGASKSFSDSSQISDYAVQAIDWATCYYIIEGTEYQYQRYIKPQDTLTRAQMAAMLVRYHERYRISPTDQIFFASNLAAVIIGSESRDEMYLLEDETAIEKVLTRLEEFETAGYAASDYTIYNSVKKDYIRFISDDTSTYYQFVILDDGIVNSDGVLYKSNNGENFFAQSFIDTLGVKKQPIGATFYDLPALKLTSGDTGSTQIMHSYSQIKAFFNDIRTMMETNGYIKEVCEPSTGYYYDVQFYCFSESPDPPCKGFILNRNNIIYDGYRYTVKDNKEIFGRDFMRKYGIDPYPYYVKTDEVKEIVLTNGVDGAKTSITGSKIKVFADAIDSLWDNGYNGKMDAMGGTYYKVNVKYIDSRDDDVFYLIKQGIVMEGYLIFKNTEDKVIFGEDFISQFK